MEVQLIPDIRIGAAGIRLLHQNTEIIKRFKPREFIDPFGIRGNVSFRDLELELESFIVELDSSWLLDGQRNFLQLNGDPKFFFDRVVGSKFAHPEKILNTDRDTSLVYDQVSRVFHYVNRRGGAEVITVPGAVGIALSSEPSNWGSFLTRILPKAILLKNMGLKQLFVYAPHENHKLMLEEAGWSRDALVLHQPYRQYRFEKGIFPSELTSSLSLGLMGTCALKSITRKSQQQNRLLYVTRRAGLSSKNKRYAINTSQIEESLSDLGFEIIRPETMTAAEQIQIFAQARMVVGPSGAGMFNTVFCSPGTRIIDIESETHWWHAHCNLFSSLHLDYSIYCARPVNDPEFPPPHRPFEVDISSLVKLIKQ